MSGQPLGHQDGSHVLSGRYPAQKGVVASEGAGVPTADARRYLQVVGVDEESIVPTILAERFDRLLQAPPMLGEAGRYPVAQVGRDRHHHQAARLGDAVGPVGFSHIGLIVRMGPAGARVKRSDRVESCARATRIGAIGGVEQPVVQQDIAVATVCQFAAGQGRCQLLGIPDAFRHPADLDLFRRAARWRR